MASKNWIKGAIKKPGALKATAKRAGALKADGTIKAYKHKSFEFRALEGILKQNDDYVDAEEVS